MGINGQNMTSESFQSILDMVMSQFDIHTDSFVCFTCLIKKN